MTDPEAPRLAVLPNLEADDTTVEWLERTAEVLRADLDKRVPVSAVVVVINRDGSYSLHQRGTREAGTLSTIGALAAVQQRLLETLGPVQSTETR